MENLYKGTKISLIKKWIDYLNQKIEHDELYTEIGRYADKMLVTEKSADIMIRNLEDIFLTKCYKRGPLYASFKEELIEDLKEFLSLINSLIS